MQWFNTSGRLRQRAVIGTLFLVGVVCGGVALRETKTGASLTKRTTAYLYKFYKQQKSARAASQQARKSPPERAPEPLTVYHNAIADGWKDWSWAEHDLRKSGIVEDGVVLSLLPSAYKGVYLHRDQPLLLGGYGTLQVRFQGAAPVNVRLVGQAGQFGAAVSLQRYVTQDDGFWKTAVVPLGDLEVAQEGITGVVVQAAGAQTYNEVYLDDISFYPDQSLPLARASVTIGVTVDAAVNRRPISPFIYGMAFAPEAYLADLNVSVNRWGGNDKSRYNWVHGNAVNAARDWRWANRVASGETLTDKPSSAADAFVRHNRHMGRDTLLTVPAIGWVARNTDNQCVSQGVPAQGDAALTGTQGKEGAIAGYDPTQNRLRTSVPSFPRKSSAFEDTPSDTAKVYQDEWVNHLKNTFGAAKQGGVRFYAMDNEPDLWASTHTDVHPSLPGYDEVLSRFIAYASAVKDVDSTAQITGPVSWGWTGYFFSALDKGKDNFRTHEERNRHGGVPFLLWFLQQVRQRDAKQGRRSLDVLDVHFYPQNGLYSQAVEPEAQARRLRSTRALWDADYPDETWIAEPVHLIPRLRDWIAEGYPGTKIGITEWNFGADQHINGALAIADVLGIFGREGVYLANYWAYPLKDSPGYLAFKLLRRPDDNVGDRFGDISVQATTQDDYKVGCFAATESTGKRLTILLINKMPATSATVPITIAGGQAGAGGRMYLLSATSRNGKKAAIVSRTIAAIADAGKAVSRTSVTLPPSSAALISLPLLNSPVGTHN